MSEEPSLDRLLERCAQEPIRTPGSIQPWGTLLAYRPGERRIRYHAANARDFLGLDEDVLGLPVEELPGMGEDQKSVASARTGRLWERDDGRLFRVHGWVDSGRAYLEYLPESSPSQSQLLSLQEEAEALIETDEIEELLSRGTRHLSELTGFDHVMAYRFRQSLDGEVVTETVRGDLPQYEGHRFPATDIPSQARQLYLEQRFRIIPDVDYEPSPILGVEDETLDLSRSRIRSVSPVHLQYLENMGVGASFSVSIVVEGSLWGLLAAHHPTARVLPDSLQRAARLYGRQLSSQLELLQRSSEQVFIEEWPEIFSVSTRVAEHERSLADQIDRESGRWLEMMGADGLVFWPGDRMRTWGTVPDRSRLQAVMSRVHERGSGPVWSTTRLAQRVPEAEAIRETASGLLALGVPWNQERILAWIRPELVREVKWGGNPNKAVEFDAGEDGSPQALSPRSSFESWVEERRGESEEWTYAEMKGARSLRQELLKARIVETERQKKEEWQEAARIDDLTGLLTHGAFHDELAGWIESASGVVILLYLDLDGFKTVNDRWGHMVGDRLLEAVSGRIQEVVRDDDLIGRVGGDEFAVALRSVGELEEAEAVAERLAGVLAEPFEIEGHRIEISASVGISRTRSDGTSADELLNEADSRMYAIKEEGGRGVLGPES